MLGSRGHVMCEESLSTEHAVGHTPSLRDKRPLVQRTFPPPPVAGFLCQTPECDTLTAAAVGRAVTHQAFREVADYAILWSYPRPGKTFYFF